MGSKMIMDSSTDADTRSFIYRAPSPHPATTSKALRTMYVTPRTINEITVRHEYSLGGLSRLMK